jgi:hypothetical protein
MREFRSSFNAKFVSDLLRTLRNFAVILRRFAAWFVGRYYSLSLAIRRLSSTSSRSARGDTVVNACFVQNRLIPARFHEADAGVLISFYFLAKNTFLHYS